MVRQPAACLDGPRRSRNAELSACSRRVADDLLS